MFIEAIIILKLECLKLVLSEKVENRGKMILVSIFYITLQWLIGLLQDMPLAVYTELFSEPLGALCDPK